MDQISLAKEYIKSKNYIINNYMINITGGDYLFSIDYSHHSRFQGENSLLIFFFLLAYKSNPYQQQLSNKIQIVINMANLFQNLRMRTQILILYIVIVGFTILLLGLTYYVQQLILNEMFMASQQLVQKQNSQHLEATVQQQFAFVQQQQHQNLLRVESINEYYQYMQEQSNFTTEHPEQCVGQQIQENQKYKIPQFCSIFYNTPNYETIIDDYYVQLQNLTSLLNTQFFNLDSFVDSRLYFTSTADEQLVSTFPPAYIIPNYLPKKRSWYINHINKYEESNKSLEYCYSDIFQSSIFKTYTITLTHSLFNKNRSLDGVIGFNINISDTHMQQTPYNVLMMNGEGQIILNKVEQFINTTNLNYIYNSNITGFNTEDWEQIKIQSKTKNGISNCQNILTNYFCRQNSYFNQDVQIATRWFDDGTNFTLILVSNISYNHQLEEQFNGIKDQIQNVIGQSIQIQVVASVIILAISVGLVIFIFRPIYELMHIAKSHVKNVGNNINAQKFKLLNNYMKIKGKIEHLKFSFINIQDIINLSKRQKSDIMDNLTISNISNQGIPASQLKNSNIPKLNLEMNFKRMIKFYGNKTQYHYKMNRKSSQALISLNKCSNI